MELDATLRDAVQDLGFDLYVADAGPAPGHTRDQDLVERAAGSAANGTPEGGTWVVSPRIEAASGGDYVVRIVAVPPDGHELRVRVETVPADSVGVRGLVMLRDLLSPATAAQAAVEQEREEAAQGFGAGDHAPVRVRRGARSWRSARRCSGGSLPSACSDRAARTTRACSIPCWRWARAWASARRCS